MNLNNNLRKICYEGESGASNIRTCIHEDIMHISLKDILITINKENKEIDDSYVTKSLSGILKAQSEALDEDEYILIPVKDPRFPNQKEIFVTQPGLYRVLSSDRSMAGKRFQKWLFHEVIPSLAKFGEYPAPIDSKGSSLTQMAEVLAQNSRILADTLARQDKLENDVSEVNTELSDVKSRIIHLEDKKTKYDFFKTVKERADELNIDFATDKENILLAWCENLSFNKNRRFEPCASGVRCNTRFAVEIIDEAFAYIKSSES